MDLSSAVRTEVVRPALTLVVPGATALGPYLIRIKQLIPDLSAYLEDHRTTAFVLGTLLVLAAGLLLDTVGAWYETTHLDSRLAKKYPEFQRDWYRYLRLSWPNEPVGQRYLRTMTLHLKFELTMAPALLIGAAGLNWLNSSTGYLTRAQVAGVSALAIVVAIYLLYEAWNSAAVLARVRYSLVHDANGEVPDSLLDLGN